MQGEKRQSTDVVCDRVRFASRVHSRVCCPHWVYGPEERRVQSAPMVGLSSDPGSKQIMEVLYELSPLARWAGGVSTVFCGGTRCGGSWRKQSHDIRPRGRRHKRDGNNACRRRMKGFKKDEEIVAGSRRCSAGLIPVQWASVLTRAPEGPERRPAIR